MVTLANLDLNLLVSLDALLSERSVTRAAERLGLSQPGVSASLARLRRLFGDELLTRAGNSYELTPLASALKSRTAEALDGIERVFSTQPAFDPASSTRNFTVFASDYAMAVTGAELSAAIAAEAPGVRLRLSAFSSDLVDRASQLLRGVDGLLLPMGFLDNLPHQQIHEDTWVCLVAADNARVGAELTMQQLSELPWVFTYHDPTAFTPSGRQLELLGVQPRITMVVQSFLALPFLIAHTDRIALVQARLAPRLTAGGDLRAVPCPFDPVPLTEAFWWHPTLDNDPEHQWLRSMLAVTGRRLAASRVAPPP